MGTIKNSSFVDSSIAVLFIAGWFFWGAQSANAATLSLSPSSGSYNVGQIINAKILVSSADQAMNAASGALVFPASMLEVVSLLKAGSIISLWVQEPTFSNAAGSVNFEGIVLNPGYRGSSGTILTVQFRVKSQGSASINFSSSSVLANDGLGTQILSNAGSAAFTLNARTAPLPVSLPVPSSVPSSPQPNQQLSLLPRISSPTHPNEDTWYSSKNPRFEWELPKGVTDVSFRVTSQPESNPGSISDGLVVAKEYKEHDDGIWYFHLRFKNSRGWGPAAHFRLQVDSSPPRPFAITFLRGASSYDVRPVVRFGTTDSLSGIDHYEVKTKEKDFVPLAISDVRASNQYVLPVQPFGKNEVVISAYDKAGNSIESSSEFEVLALDAPRITKLPAELMVGELLEIGGETYPDVTVTVFLKNLRTGQISEQETKSNSLGNFNLIWGKSLTRGTYEVWAEAEDVRGARSRPSVPVEITVKSALFTTLGALFINYISLAILSTLLFFTLLFISWFGWHKFTQFRKKLQKEVQEAEDALHRAFDLLKEDIQDQIKMLEKAKTRRELTEEEAKILKQFKAHLGDAERFIRKEIKDIEEQVNQ